MPMKMNKRETAQFVTQRVEATRVAAHQERCEWIQKLSISIIDNVDALRIENDVMIIAFCGHKFEVTEIDE